jgi:site-specific recombinase XerD
MKKAPIHAPCYLEPEEVKAILAQPDRSTIEGQRDHALFSFLYNTGARIQEALDPAHRVSASNWRNTSKRQRRSRRA